MRRYIIPTLIASLIGLLVGPVIAPFLRPVARGGIKAGFSFYHSARRRLAELSETLDDLANEARQDLANRE